MKKIAALCILSAGLVLSASAQTGLEKPATSEVKTSKPVKIGYTNASYILSISPASKIIQKQLEETQKQFLKTIEDKSKEFETKLEAYQKAQSTMLESIKKDKEEELRNLQSSIENLQRNAQEDLRKKENDLVKPELDKIYKAVNEVAKANNFTHVFNSDQVLLYADEESDLTDMVLDKLGIKAPVEGAEIPETKPAPSPASTPAQKPAGGTTPAKKGNKK